MMTYTGRRRFPILIAAIAALALAMALLFSPVQAQEGSAPGTEPGQSVSEGDTDLPNDNSTPGRVAVGGSATAQSEPWRSGPVRGRARSGAHLPVRPDGPVRAERHASGHLFPGTLQQRGTVPAGQLQRRLQGRPRQPGDVHATRERDVLRAGVGRPGRDGELHAERDRSAAGQAHGPLRHGVSRLCDPHLG